MKAILILDPLYVTCFFLSWKPLDFSLTLVFREDVSSYESAFYPFWWALNRPFQFSHMYPLGKHSFIIQWFSLLCFCSLFLELLTFGCWTSKTDSFLTSSPLFCICLFTLLFWGDFLNFQPFSFSLPQTCLISMSFFILWIFY